MTLELPKLVATDLDGTLVRSDETVSDHSLAVLRKVQEAGVPVIGVTGRGPRLIELCRRDLPGADAHVARAPPDVRPVDGRPHEAAAEPVGDHGALADLVQSSGPLEGERSPRDPEEPVIGLLGLG